MSYYLVKYSIEGIEKRAHINAEDNLSAIKKLGKELKQQTENKGKELILYTPAVSCPLDKDERDDTKIEKAYSSVIDVYTSFKVK